MENFGSTGDIQLDEKCKNFLNNPHPDAAFDILIYCRCSNKPNYTILFGEYFLTLFPYNNYNILNEVANAYFYNKNYKKASKMYTKLLGYKLSQEFAGMILYNLTFSLNQMKDIYTEYDESKAYSVIKNPLPYVTLSVTTCKRLDLFEKTINSFLKCVLDRHLISEYICVDDNSSEEDREIMKKKYPFFTFYFKTPEERGHPKSMNIIKKMCKTKYLFHIEDDWEFLIKDNYISKCIHVLRSDPSLKQCLLNKNYGEIPSCLGSTVGGEFRMTPETREGSGGIRYYIHEHMSGPEYAAKYGVQRNCSYWPHFSFRPSIVETSIFNEIGDFNEGCIHFEMEYANRYVSKGYKSGFLEGIYCRHIGRLTSDRSGIINAYDLNNQKQFHESQQTEKVPYPCYIVNLDRRPDRWMRFEKIARENQLNECLVQKYTRFSAIDGKKLVSTRQLRRIFDPNNYNWTRGVLGCALSHLSLWVQLVHSQDEGMIVLEDDIEFKPLFKTKLEVVYNESKKLDWDLIHLGTFQRNPPASEEPYKMPKLTKRAGQESINYSYGGTIGYMVSKKGAIKLLEFLNHTGMICAIDTMIFMAANNINLYFVEPDLIKSECVCVNSNADSDIQRGYNDQSTHLTVTFDQRIQDEINSLGRLNIINDISQLDPNYVNINYSPGKDVDGYKWYPLGNGSLYIKDELYPVIQDKLWFDRLKVNGAFSVKDAIHLE